MQPDQFDIVSRLFGARADRRSALRKGGGLIAAASGIAGIERATAHEATPLASPDAEADAAPPAFLFVQSFHSGTMTPAADDPNTFTLTLQHGGGQTVYFSDRPDRIVGSAPTQAFLDGMSFDPGNPPNAALVMETAEHETDVVVVELTEPAYDADAATLTYTATLLADYQELGMTLQEAPASAAELKTSFAGASLFIDDCADEKIACVIGSGGEDDCIGNVSVGYCWDWGSMSCLVCHDYSSICNSSELAPWCSGNCVAMPDLTCPNDCTYC